MPKFKDLSGNKYGRLSVLQRATPHISETGQKYSRWECVCECGIVLTVLHSSLVSGNTKSCGCYRRELHIQSSTTHGKSKTKVYRAYLKMKARCTDKNDVRYEHYGGRGVIVCERWSNSFENFLDDMGEPPSPKHSLDRVEVNGNYEPSNCRWATTTQQARNKRIAKNNTSGIVGVHISGVNKREYVARWIDPLGTKRTRSFNMDKYGESEALKMAVLAREAGVMESENTECAYGVSHGV